MDKLKRYYKNDIRIWYFFCQKKLNRKDVYNEKFL
nr:MAG TPA: hypothetical protein [Caudoviricetes sp.]